MGHDEAALAAARVAFALMNGNGDVDMSKRSRAITRLSTKLDIDSALGDFDAALRDGREQAALPEYSGSAEGGRESVAGSLAGLHDVSAARRAWNDLPASDDPATRLQRSLGRLVLDTALEDWPSILAEQDDVRKIFAGLDAQHVFIIASYGVGGPRQVWPAVANAMAATGDFAGAHALIDRTPARLLRLPARARPHRRAGEKLGGGQCVVRARDGLRAVHPARLFRLGPDASCQGRSRRGDREVRDRAQPRASISPIRWRCGARR